MLPINFLMQINDNQLAMRDKADLLIAHYYYCFFFFTKYVNENFYFALCFVLLVVFFDADNGNARFIAD